MKQPKYKNHRTAYMGITFDSELERDRYIYLSGQKDSGNILSLERQVAVELIPAVTASEEVRLKTKTVTKEKVVQRAVKYVADFVYTLPDGSVIYEDTKSRITVLNKDFILKRKMLLAFKGIELYIAFRATAPLGKGGGTV